MDVSAIAQVTQGQSAAAAQDSSGDSASALFSYLLKHQFDGGQAGTGGSLMNAQPMLDMVGTAPAYVPPPTPPAPQATTTSNPTNNSQSQSSQSGNGNGSSGASQSGQPVATVNSNGGGNSGSGAQTDSGNQGSQQNSSNSNSSGSGTQTSSNAPAPVAARAASDTGEDATTEATAAALAAPIHLIQQPTATKSLSVDPTLQAGAKVDPTTGPAPTAAAPSAAPTASNATPAASAAQAAAASAADDSAPEATPWSLNFLNTASAASPQIAQQAAGLSKLTGGTAANVSVQTTSGTTVSAPSTSTLVPDAVLATSGFLQDGGQGGSTGGGLGNQSQGQQTADGTADATQLDPDAALLAEDAQALMALTSTIQTVAQNLAANAALPQAIDAAASAAPAAASTTAETVLPQPTTPTSSPANASGFAAQLQEAEQTEAPQANRPIALPSAIDQIKMQIEKGIAAGSSTIKVQLTPENMGRVEVKLEVQNGSVKATITADRADTLQVLKSDQTGLVQSLQDAGLNADSNSLSFFLRGDQQRQFAQSNRQGRNQSGGSAGDDDPLLAGVTAASGASSGAGAGNLDISV